MVGRPLGGSTGLQKQLWLFTIWFLFSLKTRKKQPSYLFCHLFHLRQSPREHGRQHHPTILQWRHLHPGYREHGRLLSCHSVGDLRGFSTLLPSSHQTETHPWTKNRRLWGNGTDAWPRRSPGLCYPVMSWRALAQFLQKQRALTISSFYIQQSCWQPVVWQNCCSF